MHHPASRQGQSEHVRKGHDAQAVILAAVKAQPVEVVLEHEGWWAHNSGPMVLAIAAITAAGLAAYVAIRNNRQQLEHDRDMRERAHVRDTIDAAMLGASATIHALSAVTSDLAVKKSHAGTMGEEAEKTLEEETEKDLLKASSAESEMRANHLRLDLRLGSSHPIVVSHGGLREALTSASNALLSGIIRKDGERSPEEAHRIAALALEDFRSACRDWFSA